MRWGPVTAGVVVAVASFLLMQLAIFAADLFGTAGDAGTWLTAAAGVVAFFLGGLVAGWTSSWHTVRGGVINGLVVWGTTVVGLLLLALFGGGTLLGPLATVTTDLVAVNRSALGQLQGDQVTGVLDAARTAAGWTLVGLAVALVTAVVGGAIGARMPSDRPSAGDVAGEDLARRG